MVCVTKKSHNCFALFSSIYSYFQENKKANLTFDVNTILNLTNNVVPLVPFTDRDFIINLRSSHIDVDNGTLLQVRSQHTVSEVFPDFSFLVFLENFQKWISHVVTVFFFFSYLLTFITNKIARKQSMVDK